MNKSLSYTPIQTGYRFIEDGKAYERYFPKPEKEDKIIIRDADVDDTVNLMKKVVWKYIEDTKKIAPILKGTTLRQTCENIWQFVYNQIQYQFDKKGLEQLRRPARAWADRTSGIDCDGMSIFISSILTNLQIPHSFRITKYSKPSWQHVYVVIPDIDKNYIIDGVVSRFNYEKPYTAKKDYDMDIQGIDVAVLSGYEEDALSEVLFGLELIEENEFTELGEIDTDTQLEAIYRHLIVTRNAVAQNPNVVAGVDDPKGFLKMLDYAINYWHTDKRQEALDVLTRYENQLNLKNGFSGEEDDLEGYDYDELGFIKPKKFFKNVGNAAKKVGKGVGKGVKAVGRGTVKVAKGVAKGTKAVAKGTVKVAKTVGKGILKFNPISVAARAGLLLAMRMNMKGMAGKIKWGYATREQAAKKGISAAAWQKSKNALTKIEKVFASKLMGSKSALRNAVLKGKAGNLNGIVEYTQNFSEFEGLGIAPAAALAAALPVIKVVLGILKKDGLVTDDNTDNLNEEVDASAQKHMKEIENQDTEIRQLDNQQPQQKQKINSNTTNKAVQRKTSIARKSNNSNQANAQQPTDVHQTQEQTTEKNNAIQNETTKPSNTIMSFIAANPIPSLLISGVLAYGIYKALAPKPSINGLEGLEGTRRRASPKRKTTPSKRAPVRKTNIKKVRLF